MTNRLPRLCLEFLPALGVLALALWVFASAAGEVEFYGDEGRYLARTRFFDYLFLQHDLGRAEWGDSDSTHTQPMLTNFMLGAWLRARGHDLGQMPLPYRWGRSPETNRAEGRVPAAGLLLEARRLMVGLAAMTVLLLYWLGRTLRGFEAGL